MVELRGFEPLTSSVPRKRATNCAKAPDQAFVPPCWATSSSIHSFVLKTNLGCRPLDVMLNTGLRQREGAAFAGMCLQHVSTTVRQSWDTRIVFVLVSHQRVCCCTHRIAVRYDK